VFHHIAELINQCWRSNESWRIPYVIW